MSEEGKIILPAGAESSAAVPPPNPLARSVVYTFASADIDAQVGARLAKLGKTARINGFRRGHVPIRVMRERWGGQCLAEVLSQKAGERFAEEVAKMSERPASSPRMIPSAVKTADGYRVECQYEAMPQVALPDLSKQKIRRPTLDIGETEVDEMISRLRQDGAEYDEVQRGAQAGDRLALDFCVRRGDEVLEEGKNRIWLLDSPTLKGEVGDALHGVVAGDRREVVLKADGGNLESATSSADSENKSAVITPENSGGESAKESEEKAAADAKEVRMELQIQKVMAPRLPELNGEFFSQFGVDGGEEEFRKMVGERLKSEVAERAWRAVHSQAMNALLAATPKFNLPRSLVGMEAAAMHSQMVREAKARGLPAATAKMQPRMFAEAARRVALGLIIANWSEREKVEIADAEVDSRLDELAGGYENPAEFKSRARRDEEMMHALRLEMMERRAAEWVCAHADTADEKTTLSQLLSGGAGA